MMLQVNSIDLHYGAAQTLRGISLTAEPGKVTCVMGRNGVGKTSLLDAVAGQHPVSRGSIMLDGADITCLSASARARRGVAYVPQGREIFPLLTVEENLKTGFAPLSREQRSITYGQRGWKWQPEGGYSGEATSPTTSGPARCDV